MKEDRIFAHGAVNPLYREKQWIYFGASIGTEDYPVAFQLADVPALIEWLEHQLDRRKKIEKT